MIISKNQVEEIRLLMSTYQDGTGQLRVKDGSTLPNWRDFERSVATTFNGYAFENKGFLDVIIDGKEITDPLNPLVTNSVKNGGNSFLIINPNFIFRLKGFSNAKSIFLAGDFDNWSEYALPMKHEGDEWIFNIHLSPGKHLYKFIVDGKWIIDPHNKLWEQNEYCTGNSVIWISN